MNETERLAEVLRWLRYAREDLVAAEKERDPLLPQ